MAIENYQDYDYTDPYTYDQGGSPVADPQFEADPEWDPIAGWRWRQDQDQTGRSAPLGMAWKWMGYAPSGARTRTNDYGWQLVNNVAPTNTTTNQTPPPNTTPPPPGPYEPGPYYPGGTTTIAAAPGADGETATAFDWPAWQSAGPLPELGQAGPFKPRTDTFEYEPFAYDPYTASSWEDAEKEPGYGASREQLRKQIEAGAAHRGMLRSGMTIGDLYTGLDSLGQQNFSNFDNRRFRNYSENRRGALDTWAGNLNAKAQKFGLELGVDRDVYDRYAQDVDRGNANRLGLYDRNATDVDRGNNYRYNVASSQFQDMLSRWQERVRSLTSIATAGANS